MTIMNHFTDNTDINIYFHMKNHYKKLRKVKSTIDNSTPQGFGKCFSATPPHSARSWKSFNFEERHARNCPLIPAHNSIFKTHNYTPEDSISDTSLRSVSLPPRPITRRHPHEMPQNFQFQRSRSQSEGRTSRKDNWTKLNNFKVKNNRNFVMKRCPREETLRNYKEEKLSRINEESSQDEETARSTKRSNLKKIYNETEEFVSRARLEEHEYLHFLLKITEDIILNNFYTNGDIEKVLHAHMTANRDRLDMEKMEAQAARLCEELNIPYKYSTNTSVSKSPICYKKFFQNRPLAVPTPQDCECSKKRSLNIGHKYSSIVAEEEQDNRANLNNNEARVTMLRKKSSLGRVSECTEPTNSMETLILSTRQTSVTTVSSFGNVDILPCFENVDINKDKKPALCAKELLEEQSGLTDDNLTKTLVVHEDPHLTEKEKIGCLEEDIMFEKTKCDDKSTENEIHNECENMNVEKVKENNEIVILKNKMSELAIINETQDKLLESNTIKCSNNIKRFYNTITSQNIDDYKNKNILKTNEITSRKEEKETVNGNILSDKYTQITVSYSDKQCNTSPKVNESSDKGDYVLLNGPVYVLKTVLNSDERLILFDEEKSVQKKDSIKDPNPEKLYDNNIALNLFQNIPPEKPLSDPDFVSHLFMNKNNLSKLLNSDYDLTPQRENYTSDKYHHLLVDVSTSVSNLHLNNTTDQQDNSYHDYLLLTDKYSVSPEKLEANVVKSIKGNLIENHVCEKNSYTFSRNELSIDGQYEIKSYSLPREINGSVNLSVYSEAKSNHETEGRFPLTEYEIDSPIDNCSTGETGEIPKEEVDVSGDVDRSAANTDTDVSQVTSIGLIKEKSPRNVITRQNKILGKRKLKHPS